METLTRVNNITPNPGDPSPPETYTLEAQRTVHGIVSKRGTVDGQPVAFTKQRSTYFHEADSARAFSAMNSPSKVQNVEDFQHVMSKVNFTFNWFYADDRDIAYFNSGDNPERADGADPDLPNWGTGEYDWKGWETHFHSSDVTPFEEHPRVINQDYITSWNNKQAPGYDAADGQLGLRAALPLGLSGRPDRPAPRGLQQDEPRRGASTRWSWPAPPTCAAPRSCRCMLQVVGTPSDPQLASAVSVLQDWVNSGAHRIDKDQDGQYDHANAVQIMDAWWPRLLEAEFKPDMGTDFFDAVQGVLGFDNEPHNHGDHLGSAYQDGWWGYVSKDLRRLLGQPVSDPFSRTYCGGGSLTACRDALRQALADAIAVPATTLYDEDPNTAGVQHVDTCPAGKSDQWCFDSVRFRPIGGVTIRTIHWINRPTFQQAIEVQGHRPRGYVRPKGATPLRVPLVVAYKACSAPNRQHGPPLAYGSCNPPEQRSDYLTVGLPGCEQPRANSSGYLNLSVFPGNPSTPADEADVNLGFSLTDVRKRTDLSDYTGQLQIDSVVRVTDRDNNESAGGGCDPPP